VADTSDVDGDLALLTDALGDPGTDLRDELTVFADQLTAAAPSFLGVTMTVVMDGVAVTLSADAAVPTPTPKATVNVSFSALMPDDAIDGQMVFCAAEVGAFADLAAVVTRSSGAKQQVAVDEHLPPPRSGHAVGVSGLAKFSARNRAIGVLIDQGHCPDQAWIELHHRATRDEVTVDESARLILDHLAVTTNQVKARTTRLPAGCAEAATGENLTPKEREILQLLITGLGTVAIAAALLVRPGTVRDHVHSIMIKLGANSRAETVAISLNENVLGIG
jgi:DNA-binding CsgD family transcriptional regulator